MTFTIQLKKKTGETLKAGTGDRKLPIITDVRSRTQSQKCINLTTVIRVQCEVKIHPKFNQSRGVIFLNEFDIDDLELFKTVYQGSIQDFVKGV